MQTSGSLEQPRRMSAALLQTRRTKDVIGSFGNPEHNVSFHSGCKPVLAGKRGDPIHLPTPDSSPAKDSCDSVSDKTDVDSEHSCTSTESKVKCSCRLEVRFSHDCSFDKICSESYVATASSVAFLSARHEHRCERVLCNHLGFVCLSM